MIQVRVGIFETNSSSANVLCVPKEQNIIVPKRFIFMDDETSSRPIEVVLCNLFDDWFGDTTETINQIINFLYLNGVEEIIYGGHNRKVMDAIEKYKDSPIDMGVPTRYSKNLLLRILFGDTTDCNYYSDEYAYEFEDDYDAEACDYIHFRTS